MQKVQKKLSETSFQDRLDFAATHSKTSVLRMCNSQCTGLCARDVLRARARFGSNALERKKQNSLASRLVQAFINPFSCILFVLALISCINDMVLPSLSLAFCAREQKCKRCSKTHGYGAHNGELSEGWGCG